MKNHTVLISDYDFALLSEMVREMWCQGKQNDFLMKLHHKLIGAKVVSVCDIPPDIITLNSRFCVEDMGKQEEMTCTLVANEAQNVGCHSVAVLSQLGVALIGEAVGHQILLKHPKKSQRLRISKLLFQPEIEFNQYYLHIKSLLN